MVKNPWLPVAAILLYGIFIKVGRAYFHNREPWSWRRTLAIWNLCLSVFSFIGFSRVAPHMIHTWYHYSISEFFCFDPEHTYGSEPSTGLWLVLFVLSKFPYVLRCVASLLWNNRFILFIHFKFFTLLAHTKKMSFLFLFWLERSLFCLLFPSYCINFSFLLCIDWTVNFWTHSSLLFIKSHSFFYIGIIIFLF
jgi:hypothetical protein